MKISRGIGGPDQCCWVCNKDLRRTSPTGDQPRRFRITIRYTGPDGLDDNCAYFCPEHVSAERLQVLFDQLRERFP